MTLKKSCHAFILTIFYGVLLLAGCGTLEIDVQYPTKATANLSERAAPSALPSATEPTALARVPPQGLVFETPQALWVIGANKQATQLVHSREAKVTSDGRRVLYYDLGTRDLWLADRGAGEQAIAERNLTRTPDDYECCFGWWPARPGTIIFGSLPGELAPQPGWTGFLSTVEVDGGNVRVLDDQRQVAGSPALSPDGQTIAYGGGSTGWLYHWESDEKTPFDPVDYGLTDILPNIPENLQIGSPAWSPDGQQLAWVVTSESLSPEGSVAIGIFDLTTRTARLLHPYHPTGMEGWPPTPIWEPDGRLNFMGQLSTPVWSLDGEWLAFITMAQDPRNALLWVVHVQGQFEQHLLGPANHLAWSPDGRWLAFQTTAHPGQPSCLVAEVGTWETSPFYIPIADEGVLVDWVNLN